jgi:hypothetical protein
MSLPAMFRANRLWETLLFGASIFASAFLIFLVQPMVGKQIVPWFGGTPAVWTLCLAFYQAALFLGYAYAHLLVAWASPMRQLWIHALLFAVAVIALPVLPDEIWKPVVGADPNSRILAMLAANVALPFLMLAATGPLLQSWFASSVPGRSPYPLYALSNLGSLLALLGYPFFIEPNLPLSLNSELWSWGFGLCGVGVIACGWFASRRPLPRMADEAARVPAEMSTTAADPMRRVLWVALPACAVVLFMGISNELCLDVASVPFLWVAPLCIYLLTFIICFASDRLYVRGVAMTAAIVLAAALVILGEQSPLGLAARSSMSLYSQIGAYALVLFVGCMLLHGELYRLRPAPELLTLYYLCVAAGGAAGGLFVGLVAPRVFSGYDELPLGIVAGWTLVVVAWWHDPGSVLRVGRRRWIWVGTACLSVAACVVMLVQFKIADGGSSGGAIAWQQRNFYGVLRVVKQVGFDPRGQIVLRNGTTGHGFQLIDPSVRSLPTNYYSRISGIGIALSHREPPGAWRVGLIGLGIGTLAAYGQPGDRFRFYEIDPDVVHIARDSKFFSYLADSRAEIEIVIGDGRLALESELRVEAGAGYDVLVLDAFTSDSIPVHLLTQEAFGLYRQHLRDDGLLAVHVSSQHLKLDPLVHRLGQSVGLHAISVLNLQNNRHYAYRSKWVLLSPDASRLQGLKNFGLASKPGLGLGDADLRFYSPARAALAGAPLWTDDYSDLFGVVKQKRLF